LNSWQHSTRDILGFALDSTSTNNSNDSEDSQESSGQYQKGKSHYANDYIMGPDQYNEESAAFLPLGNNNHQGNRSVATKSKTMLRGIVRRRYVITGICIAVFIILI
jgi:hypothetical protein